MRKRSIPVAKLARGLVILYEDRDILVVDKPAGLLTIGTESDKSRTAYFILTDYVRKGSARSRNRVFIVHRLDRDTSGVLVFAKSEEAKLRLQGEWGKTEKKYLAVVHGKASAREARRPSPHTWQRTKRMSCTPRRTLARESCPIRPIACSSRRWTLLCWK
jgi:23S rRNA-/tRNA-specific pseudouridylate synthase